MHATWNPLARITSSLVLGSSLVWGLACGGGGGGSDDAPAPATTQPTGASVTGGTPVSSGGATVTDGTATGSAPTPTTDGGPAAFNCESAWASYVAANPAGLTLGYRVTTETKDGSGAVINSFTSENETKVIESNDTRVVTSDGELSKAQFLEGCSQVGGLDFGQVDADVTVLEEGPQTITVPAGTFATNYSKTSVAVGVGEGETIVSNWVLNDGSNITVKSDVSMSSTVAGFSFQNRTITELVKIVRP